MQHLLVFGGRDKGHDYVTSLGVAVGHDAMVLEFRLSGFRDGILNQARAPAVQKCIYLRMQQRIW
jgi:hypothetical protein